MKVDAHQIFGFILAALLLCFGIVAAAYQVTTTEALTAGGGSGNINLAVLVQPVTLIGTLFNGGSISATDLVTILVGWGVELCYFVFAWVFEHVHKGISGGSRLAAEVFGWGIFICFAINFVADYHFGPALGSGWVGHLAFAALMSFMVAFFPLAAVFTFEHVR